MHGMDCFMVHRFCSLFDSSFSQCFIAHPTRIFVYGLCITKTKLCLYRYDRCGILYSDWVNYREKHAHELVRALLIISSPDPAMLGFDETVVINKAGKHVFSMEQDGKLVKLTEVSLEWNCLSLTGRSTTCWKVINEDTKKGFLLKQQFVNIQRTPEHELLEEVKGIKGIVKVHFAQRIGKLMSELRGTIPPNFHDRFLYRMVVEEYGKSIKCVTDVLLLIKAMRDVITGIAQGGLYQQEVLHRDISANNILYAKDPKNLRKDEGYGNLIDFELSINPDRTTSLDGKDFRTGTHAFHSIRVLRSDPKTYHPGYLDDLESFFWVLVWILIRLFYPIDNTDEKRTKDSLKAQQKVLDKFEDLPSMAADWKRGFLAQCSDQFILNFIGSECDLEVVDFVEHLGAFFLQFVRLAEKRLPIPDDANDHYKGVISLFDTAIDNLERAQSAPGLVANLNAASTHAPPPASIQVEAPAIAVTQPQAKKGRSTKVMSEPRRSPRLQAGSSSTSQPTQTSSDDFDRPA
ncbi:hypothetical protein CVT24_004680 [Panaeolus cyanescens]|uniref:Fungal-type protein kinase domain-containing protein n=1 Tax=Panaeolus cyanescens TaxID=181874 RepID=A0A409WYH3_9AGAR|nr:hypothetical protein CVT24_004680 [Panaeolus cyanescens]